MAETTEAVPHRRRKGRFSIANRVWLVMGLLLFLFFVTSSVSHLLTKRIESDVKHLVLIEDTRHDAVTNMGIRLAEFARSVFAYAHDSAGLDIDDIDHWQGEIEKAVRVYGRLADNDEERGLSAQISTFFDEFRTLSAEIVALTDEQRRGLGPLRSKMQAVDSLIEERVQEVRTLDQTSRMSKVEAVLGMESTISEHIGFLEAYAASGRPENRDKARMSQAAFEWFVTGFRNSGLTDDERSWLGTLVAEFGAMSDAGNRVMQAIDRKRTLLNSF